MTLHPVLFAVKMVFVTVAATWRVFCTPHAAAASPYFRTLTPRARPLLALFTDERTTEPKVSAPGTNPRQALWVTVWIQAWWLLLRGAASPDPARPPFPLLQNGLTREAPPALWVCGLTADASRGPRQWGPCPSRCPQPHRRRSPRGGRPR